MRSAQRSATRGRRVGRRRGARRDRWLQVAASRRASASGAAGRRSRSPSPGNSARRIIAGINARRAATGSRRVRRGCGSSNQQKAHMRIRAGTCCVFRCGSWRAYRRKLACGARSRGSGRRRWRHGNDESRRRGRVDRWRGFLRRQQGAGRADQQRRDEAARRWRSGVEARRRAPTARVRRSDARRTPQGITRRVSGDALRFLMELLNKNGRLADSRTFNVGRASRQCACWQCACRATQPRISNLVAKIPHARNFGKVVL